MNESIKPEGFTCLVHQLQQDNIHALAAYKNAVAWLALSALINVGLLASLLCWWWS